MKPGSIVNRTGARAALAALLAAAVVLAAAPAMTQPVIVESGWTLLRTISFNNPMAAHYNPVDGHIYTGQRNTIDGLYRIDRFGLWVQVSDGSNTAAVFCHPDSGFMFSGYKEQVTMEELADQNLSGFMHKPFDVEKLARMLRAALEDREDARVR